MSKGYKQIQLDNKDSMTTDTFREQCNSDPTHTTKIRSAHYSQYRRQRKKEKHEKSVGECGQLNLSWIGGSKRSRDKPGQAFGQWPWAQALERGTRALQPSTEGHTRRWSHKHTGNKAKEHDTAKTLPEAKQVQKKHFHQRRWRATKPKVEERKTL